MTELQTQTQTQTRWWLSSDRKWRRGRPPKGWWQAANRRWHPPDDSQSGGGLAYEADTTPRHLASAGELDWDGYDDEDYEDDEGVGPPALARLGVLVSLGAVMLVVAGTFLVLTTGSSGTVRRQDPSLAPSGQEDGGSGRDLPTGAGQTSEPDEPADGSEAVVLTGNEASPGESEEGSEPDESSSERQGELDGPPASNPDGEGPDDTQPSGSDDSTDECQQWVPPGRPDHPRAPEPPKPDECQ